MNNHAKLCVATHNGDVELAEQLIAAGLDLDARAPGGRTALHEGVEGGHEKIVSILLASGANPNISTQRIRGEAAGYAPLHFAVEGGKLQIAQMLLRAGARVNARMSD